VVAEQAKEGEDDKAGDEDKVAAEEVNESKVDLDEFLNTMMTPGMDDSPDMKINPVMYYCVERAKREEKLRAEEEALAEGDGGQAKKDEKKDDEPAAPEHKVSAIKRLGWSLSKDAAVAADGMKQVKNVEAYLSKSLDVDVRKTPLVRATKAGAKTANALIASEMLAMAARKTLQDDSKKEHRLHAAEAGRAQLRLMKMKTRVAEEDVPEEKEDDGEEGEEGEEGAGQSGPETVVLGVSGVGKGPGTKVRL